MSEEKEKLTDWAVGALNGDREALERLLAALRPRFVRFVLRHTGDADLAEEVAQETLVKIYEKMENVRDPKAFEGWAFQVASNSLRDYFRKSKRTEEMKERLADYVLTTNPMEDPAKWAAQNELTEMLGWTISRMDEKHRIVLQLHEIEGMDHAAIAEALDIPEGTVWSRLYYARKTLRDTLKKQSESAGGHRGGRRT